MRHHTHHRLGEALRFARAAFMHEGGRFGRHREHGGDERHGHGRGRHRRFDQGDLRLVLLRLIADKPRHGYDMIKAIEDLIGGGYSPSPGVIYPTLTLLEELGYVTVASEDGKKRYEATEAGTAYLAANQEAVSAIFARMAEGREKEPAPQLLRAMANLRTALKLRIAQGPIPEERLAAIAAAIDAAAGEAER
jgi:DNA-binding PadR family transcriptional regulator